MLDLKTKVATPYHISLLQNFTFFNFLHCYCPRMMAVPLLHHKHNDADNDPPYDRHDTHRTYSTKNGCHRGGGCRVHSPWDRRYIRSWWRRFCGRSAYTLERVKRWTWLVAEINSDWQELIYLLVMPFKKSHHTGIKPATSHSGCGHWEILYSVITIPVFSSVSCNRFEDIASETGLLGPKPCK